MWPYVLCGAGITALFSLSLPLYGVTETTVGIVERISLYLLLPAGLGLAACILLKRAKSRDLSDATYAEFVGNIRMAWNIQATAELATVRRRSRLPPQSIFFLPARLDASVALKAGQQIGQGNQQR